MPYGILGGLPPGARGYLAGEESMQRRGANQLNQAMGILGLRNQMEMQPLQRQLLEAQVSQAQDPAPVLKDMGGYIAVLNPKTFQEVGRMPKTATPDAALKESGAAQRHGIPSGSAVLGAQTTIRGQDLQEGRERIGPPQEVTVGGRPALVVQDRRTGQLRDPNTMGPITGAGPKIGETAQKQQTGVANTKDAISEYRQALKGFGATDILNPAARARMGTIYNNMLLQAKEAYNLGVLNGPDYMILQQVITNPASMTGAITPKADLDAQAKTLDEIMGRIGGQVTTTQTGQPQERRQADRRGQFKVLGVER